MEAQTEQTGMGIIKVERSYVNPIILEAELLNKVHSRILNYASKRNWPIIEHNRISSLLIEYETFGIFTKSEIFWANLRELKNSSLWNKVKDRYHNVEQRVNELRQEFVSKENFGKVVEFGLIVDNKSKAFIYNGGKFYKIDMRVNLPTKVQLEQTNRSDYAKCSIDLLPSIDKDEYFFIKMYAANLLLNKYVKELKNKFLSIAETCGIDVLSRPWIDRSTVVLDAYINKGRSEKDYEAKLQLFDTLMYTAERFITSFKKLSIQDASPEIESILEKRINESLLHILL